MSVQSIADYAAKKGVSARTIYRKISLNQLPSTDMAKKVGGSWVIMTNKCMECEAYFNASVEFNERKRGKKVTTGEINQFNFELAAQICVKYDLGATKFFKIHNL